ncbi:glycosyl hydrolase [Microvirga sp. BSC39]|uniref:glycoside hydrolase family 26 protein n=1 Tax=Microvirga sp. BSC39 TaxID=1549810 RepID=UPI00068FB79C|nr:glycosyl hydrolase [Microvirga sp. BSC39]
MRLEIGLAALACLLFASNMQRSAQADSASTAPRLGVYDPHKLLRDDERFSLEHTFLYWQNFKPEEYRTLASDAARRGRQVIVTVEPWTRAPNWKDGSETLLTDVIAGEFDREISAICHEIGASGAPVMVSWGHEMDETQGRFPWANKDPELFQKAYRHFVNQCRPHAPEARFGWTPKGEATLASYYPGDAYVDFIGLTLFDLEAWNIEQNDHRTFADKFGALHGQVVNYGKPIVLVEFGVSGTESYEETWLSCAQEKLRRFPQVEALVYFNDQETWHWPEPHKQPDWRITDSRKLGCKREFSSLR